MTGQTYDYLVYDAEIKKAIKDRNGEYLPGIEYCRGWHDHAGMGVSVMGAYDAVERAYRVFMDDNMSEFVGLCRLRQVLVGFNSIRFDNTLCKANGIWIPDDKCYDILREIWIASELNPDKFYWKTHGGFGLDDMFRTNFPGMRAKEGEGGGYAPIAFQRGEYGKLIDYNLNDIRMTEMLFQKIINEGGLTCPKTGLLLQLPNPFNELTTSVPKGRL